LSDQAIQQHIEYANTAPTALSTMHLYPIDGAAHEIDPHETAFNYRDANWAQGHRRRRS
jgi:hypothetical protein